MKGLVRDWREEKVAYMLGGVGGEGETYQYHNM